MRFKLADRISFGPRAYHYHRLGMPAIVWVDGTKQWYFRGKCHRLSGQCSYYVQTPRLTKRSIIYEKEININTSMLVI